MQNSGISTEIWITVIGGLFIIIQSLSAIVVKFLINEIRNLNKTVIATTQELITLRSKLWSKEQMAEWFELKIGQHKENCDRCAVDCLNYRSYKNRTDKPREEQKKR